jgi:MoaA/NifB/PqqE/SkfB family radical SAM enzyme
MIATNGDYIKGPDMIRDLYNAGLNQLQINVYDENRFDQLEDWLESIWWLERGNVNLRCSPKKAFYTITEKWDYSNGRVGKFELSNRSGNIELIPPMVEPIKSTCVRPFRIMQVNWKGRVVLCCNDYQSEVVMGNVVTLPLVDIWNSDGFMKYRRSLQAKNRNLPLCDVCSFRGGAYKHVLEKV